MSEQRFLTVNELTPDHTNRLDALHEDSLPESIRSITHDIRTMMRTSLESKIPECSLNEIHTIDDLFFAATSSIEKQWQTSPLPDLLKRDCEEWNTILPDTPQLQEVRGILRDPAQVSALLSSRQMGALEPLRKALPEAWKKLLVLSSERQLETIGLLRQWLKEIPEEKLQECDVQRAEVELLLEMGASLGKYFDHAFIRQMELADLPGGSAATKLGKDKRKGAQYVYDPYVSEQSDEIAPRTYAQMFPFEWPRIQKHFERLAVETDRLLVEGRLPRNKYADLPAFLHKLADAYGSPLTDPEALAVLWKDIYESGAALSLKGCPLAVIAQAIPTVTGDANKVDVELRLGFTDARTRALMKHLAPTHDEGQQFFETLLAGKEDLVDEYRTISPAVLTSHALGFGPNLYWRVDAEQRPGHSLLHPDVVRESTVKDLPRLKRIFDIELAPERYAQAALTELDAHETGHMVFSWMDQAVSSRIGLNEQSEAWILEELKAETVGAHLLTRRLKHAKDIDVYEQLAAKLSSILYYVTQKSPEDSGERYYFTGLAQLQILLAEGIIVPEGNRYTIRDPERGLQALAKRGEDLLRTYYANPDATPADVRAFVSSLKESVASDQRVQEFLQTIRGIL
ncbi:MAG: hypothetical protein PHX87_05995 [Candidatus Peribacteraceae bacterium]|nr:hypothetical protein [Candidatus Peribacteraceae bacterium]MDD5742942.1 hypothetical protein [Candidatus Peribacteraceae bacterium]